MHKTDRYNSSRDRKAGAYRLIALVAVLFVLSAAGARAQSSGTAPRVTNAGSTRGAVAGIAQPMAAQVPSAASDDELKLVIALFRHGVRAPLDKFAERANEHSGEPWPPSPTDWHAKNWGDLTERGAILAKSLGRFYAFRYRQQFNEPLKVFLWADVDARNKDTAKALAEGFKIAGVADVTVKSNDVKPDPLYHAFEAKCGTPSAKHLLAISSNISVNAQSYIDSHKLQFVDLYNVLACPGPSGAQKCTPLSDVTDNTAGYCTKQPPEKCSSPIEWKGQFSYASSASEAFLLEYANGMHVGWNPEVKIDKVANMLALHEFYFDQMQREPYLAQIDASNLLKEILDLVRRKVSGKTYGCPRAGDKDQFVGLVGHDTNLAGVGALLKLTWHFTDPNLPDNDALPAGALVFELRQKSPKPPDDGYFVRVYYLAQNLKQMRNAPNNITTAVFAVDGPLCQGGPQHCDIPLTDFDPALDKAIGKEFLSRCDENKQQVCP